MPLHKTPNKFCDRYKPAFGIPTLPVAAGETFDINNDLTLGDDMRTVYHRDGHVSYGGPADAILEYNKRHMTKESFTEFYGDNEGGEEYSMLYGGT